MRAVIKDTAAFSAALTAPKGAADVTISAADGAVTVSCSWAVDVEAEYHPDRKRPWDVEKLTLDKAVRVPADVAEHGAFSISADAAARLAGLIRRGEDAELSRGTGEPLYARIGSQSLSVPAGAAKASRIARAGCQPVAVPLRLLRSVIGRRPPCESSMDLACWVAVEASPEGTVAMWTDGAQMSFAEGDPDLPAPRVYVPVAVVKTLRSLDGGTPVEIMDGEVRCGPAGDPTCTVGFDLRPPRYPCEGIVGTLRQAPGASYARIRTECRTVTGMLDRLRSCTREEVVLSARGGALRMLAYDPRPNGASVPWEMAPKAEAWEPVAIDGTFSRVAVDAGRLRDLCAGDGECTIWIMDGDSPVHIYNEFTGIKTVLMPMSPSYDKATVDD
jgi:hypothetical protein